MMKCKFLVQNPHSIPVSKQVEIEGEATSVTIDGFEVQLLSQDGMSGTLVLRTFGANAKAARELFKVDAIVEADFKLVHGKGHAHEPHGHEDGHKGDDGAPAPAPDPAADPVATPAPDA